ncbi:MAG: hypothetical protein QM642_01225 [Edaphocola sp.]
MNIFTPGPNFYHNVTNMVSLADGNFTVLGRTFSWGQTNGSIYNMRVSREGQELGHNLYAGNYFSGWSDDIVNAPDQNHAFNFGVVNSYYQGPGSSWVNKVDSLGNEIWNWTYEQKEFNNEFFSGTANPDSGVTAVGYFRNDNIHGSKALITRLDKNGSKKWSKVYQPAGSWPEGDIYLYAAASLPDGSVVAGGSAFAQNNYGKWTQDALLLRIDSNGCVDAQCTGVLGIGTPGNPVGNGGSTMEIYPNPTNGQFRLRSSRVFEKGTKVVVTDQVGRKVRTLPSPEGQMYMDYKVEGLAAAPYYLIVSQGEQHQIQKIILTE